MPTFRWKIDCRDLEKRYMKGSKIWAKYFRDQAIDRRKYYEDLTQEGRKQCFKKN